MSFSVFKDFYMNDPHIKCFSEELTVKESWALPALTLAPE